MTRKDYVKLAEALYREKPGSNWNPNKLVQWELDRKAIAAVLQADNPRFNRSKFNQACLDGIPSKDDKGESDNG